MYPIIVKNDFRSSMSTKSRLVQFNVALHRKLLFRCSEKKNCTHALHWSLTVQKHAVFFAYAFDSFVCFKQRHRGTSTKRGTYKTISFRKPSKVRSLLSLFLHSLFSFSFIVFCASFFPFRFLFFFSFCSPQSLLICLTACVVALLSPSKEQKEIQKYIALGC